MFQFLKKEKNNLIIALITLSMIGSLGIEAGQFRDINSYVYFNIVLNTDEGGFPLAVIKTIVNFGRIFSPLICLIFLFIYFLINFKEIKVHINLSIIIFLAYAIFGIVGFFINMDLYYYESYYENVWRNSYLSLQSITFFLLILLLLSLPKKNFDNYLKLVFFVIFLVYAYFSFLNLNNYIFDVPNYDLYATDYNVNALLMGYEVPRSSGIARIYLICIIFILFFLLNLKFKKNYNIIFFTILPIIISLVFLLNSRTAILSLFLMSFLIFLISERSFFYKIVICILISIISYSLLVIIPKSKNKIFYSTQIDNYLLECNFKIRRENLSNSIKQDIYHHFVQYKEDTKCSEISLIQIEKFFPELFINDREMYFTNRNVVNKKTGFLDLLNFFFKPMEGFTETRINSADKKNIYLERKKNEEAFQKIITEKNFSLLDTNLLSPDDSKNLLSPDDSENLLSPDDNENLDTKTYIIAPDDYKKFNYNKEVKLIDIKSSIYRYIDIFSQSSEELSSEPVALAKQQKSILDRLLLDKSLTKNERIIVVIKLKRVNEIIRFTNTLIDCPYLENKINNLLTGRLCHWYTLLNETGIKIFGNGPKFDRNVLKWGASSAPLYSYVTSGIFGLIFYLYVSIKFLFFTYESIKLRFKKNSFKTPIVKQIFIMILFFLLIRSTLEGSFAYWGVDQLIFISLFVYYEKYIYRKLS